LNSKSALEFNMLKALGIATILVYFIAGGAQSASAAGCKDILTAPNANAATASYAVYKLHIPLTAGPAGLQRLQVFSAVFRVHGIYLSNYDEWTHALNGAFDGRAQQDVVAYAKVVNDEQKRSLISLAEVEGITPELVESGPVSDVTPLRVQLEGFVQNKRISQRTVNILAGAAEQMAQGKEAQVRLVLSFPMTQRELFSDDPGERVAADMDTDTAPYGFRYSKRRIDIFDHSRGDSATLVVGRQDFWLTLNSLRQFEFILGLLRQSESPQVELAPLEIVPRWRRASHSEKPAA
jgi:hypothetical protein